MTPRKIESFRSRLLQNNLVALLCMALVAVCFIMNYLERREERALRMKYAYYVQTNGEVIPAAYQLRRDNIEVEIRHHLSMFVDAWYSLDENSWERKAEAAGWLGGNSIRDMYLRRRQEGFFNRFIQSNIVQTASIQSLEIEPAANGYSFDMVVDVVERGSSYTRLWRILTQGRIALTERNWPHNPHGLWIEPFLEMKIVEVQPEKPQGNGK